MKIIESGTREDLKRSELKQIELTMNIIKKQLDLNPNLAKQRTLEKALKELQLKHHSIEEEIEAIIQNGLHKGYMAMPHDCFLRTDPEYEKLGLQGDGRIYWKDASNYAYSWDGKSREVEVFGAPPLRTHRCTKNVQGIKIKPAVLSRHAKFIS